MSATAIHSLAEHARTLLDPHLRSLSLFGSQLWAADPDGARGIPDLFAVLDDDTLAQAAAQLGQSPPRWLLHHLPPLTLLLRLPGSPESRAKLNLVEITPLHRALRAMNDVYLAGRLSKPMRLLHARDSICTDEQHAIATLAAEQISHAVLCGHVGSRTLDEVVAECAWLSYRGELRPEGPRKLQALFDRNAAELLATFRPIVLAAAPCLGLRYDEGAGLLIDARPPALRQQQQRAYARLIHRSRFRSALRWPKQMWVYRGWAAYVVDKLRRSQRTEESPCRP